MRNATLLLARIYFKNELSISKNTSPQLAPLARVGLIAQGAADLAFPVFAADAVAFFFRFPLIAPIRSVAAFGATVFGLLCFVAHLAVRLFAVEHAFDLKVIGVLPEEDAMVLSAQADHGRNDAFELLGRAFAGKNVAAQGLENLDGDGLLDAANVGLGLVGPDDTFGH